MDGPSYIIFPLIPPETDSTRGVVKRWMFNFSHSLVVFPFLLLFVAPVCCLEWPGDLIEHMGWKPLHQRINSTPPKPLAATSSLELHSVLAERSVITSSAVSAVQLTHCDRLLIVARQWYPLLHCVWSREILLLDMRGHGLCWTCGHRSRMMACFR